MRVLVAEDDPDLGEALREGLRLQGFQVDWVRDGFLALRELERRSHEAAILDLGLPRLDGAAVLRGIRTAGLAVPVLVLTARDTVADRVAGLDLGADDFVVKPVDLLELGARLRALIRRSHGQVQPMLDVASGAIRVDPASRSVTRAGADIELKAREFDLLHLLLRHRGQVLTRERIESGLYAWGQEVESNAVEVHIHHLRRKLGGDLIRTVRGVGYVIPDEGPL